MAAVLSVTTAAAAEAAAPDAAPARRVFLFALFCTQHISNPRGALCTSFQHNASLSAGEGLHASSSQLARRHAPSARFLTGAPPPLAQL
jgi:hypothetical protein